MNPKRNTTCTRTPWNCGGMSGYGIDGYELQPFRMRDGFKPENGTGCTFRIQRGQLYGVRVQGDYDTRRAESTRLELLYGYAQYYCRNTCGLVMSRKMRKEGKTTTDGMYNRAKEAHKKLRCPVVVFHTVYNGSEHFSDYTVHTATGEYHITAVFDGKQCIAYRVWFANTQGKLAGGLWVNVGHFGNLKQARKAVRAFERDNA